MSTDTRYCRACGEVHIIDLGVPPDDRIVTCVECGGDLVREKPSSSKAAEREGGG